MHNIEIPQKNKSLSLFHINACSLNKNFDDLQHLLNCTKNLFDIIAISETRITKQVFLLNNLNLNNYSIEFTPAETSAGGTLLYILPIIYHINVVMTLISMKRMNWSLLSLKKRKANIIVGVI